MQLSEAYLLMQDASHIEIGDKVKVLRRAASREMGWGVGWTETMDSCVGRAGRVVSISPSGGMGVNFPDGSMWNFPFFVLEVVEKASTHTIVIDGKECRISDESYKELKRVLTD